MSGRFVWLVSAWLTLAVGCSDDGPVTSGGSGDTGGATDTAGGGSDVSQDSSATSDTAVAGDTAADSAVQPDTAFPDVPSDLNDEPFDPVEYECVTAGDEMCDNGRDDDCDGLVDEVCGCAPRDSTQACYPGDPNHLAVTNGGCQAGVQTCGLEFWGRCEGPVGPVPEVCDDEIDNDCDGEIDEDCGGDPPQALCPDDFAGPVLNTYQVRGEYFDAAGEPMTRAVWNVLAAPPGHSFDLSYLDNGLTLEFFADVAGQYIFQLIVFNQFGQDDCQTRFMADTADVLRVEMFWNDDFVDSDEGRDCSDLDLYLHQEPEEWDDWRYYRSPGTPDGMVDGHAVEWPNPNACNWQNCATCTVPYSVGDLVRERQCREFLTEQAEICVGDDICPDPNEDMDWGSDDELQPRLDLDDVEGHGPENINIRQPNEGVYRIGVHHFAPDATPARGCEDFTRATAFVRILCANASVFESEGVQMTGTLNPLTAQFWEIGELTITYDGESPHCELEEFGRPGCRHICLMNESDGGCSTEEIREQVGSCIDE